MDALRRFASSTARSNSKLGTSSSLPCGNTQEFNTMEAALALDRAVLVDRVRGALWGTLIADAVSMPVHWCGNVQRNHRDPNWD